jgi:hypothetical protein
MKPLPVTDDPMEVCRLVVTYFGKDPIDPVKKNVRKSRSKV